MPDPRIAEYLRYLQVERGLQPLTLEAYGADLRQFALHLDGPLDGAAREDLAGFLGALHGSGLSPRAAARKLSSLRGFYRWALLRGIVAADPTEHLQAPGGRRVLPKALAETVVAQTLRAAGEKARALAEPEQGHLYVAGPVRKNLSEAGQAAADAQASAEALRDHAILELLYAGGLRASELTALTVASLKLSALRLRVRGKRDKERLTPIGRAAAEALDRYLRHGRPMLARGRALEPALFLSGSGRPLTRQWVWALVKRATGGAGSPHTLRHSCATHMVDHGADLRSVQTVLGHADIATTEVYTHVALGRLREVHRRFHPREQKASGRVSGKEPQV